MKSLSLKNKQLDASGKPQLTLSPSLILETEDKSRAYKSFRKQEKKSKDRIVYSLKGKQIEDKIKRIENAKRRKLYFDSEIQRRHQSLEKEHKTLYSGIFYNAIMQKDTERAMDSYAKIKSYDAKETHIKGQMVKFLKNQKEYSDLINLYELDTLVSPWSKIGQAKAMYLKAKSENNRADIMRAISIYLELEEFTTDNPKLCGMVYNGLGKLYSVIKEYQKSRDYFLTGVKKARFGYIANSLCIGYAECYLKEGNTKQAELILTLLKDSSSNALEGISDPIVAVIKAGQKEKKWLVENNLLYREKKKSSTPKFNSIQSDEMAEKVNSQFLNVLYSLAKLYEQTNNKLFLKQTLDEIQELNPSDKFLRKRIAN